MTPRPRFSVCIAVRDRPTLLVRAVRSVLASSYPDFEVVVVDDGSRIPAEVALGRDGVLDDVRVRVIRQPPAGIARARNAALWAARGDLITVLDSDDELLPDGLERLSRFIGSDRSSWVYTDYQEVVGGRTRTIRLPTYSDPERLRLAILLRPRLPFKHSGLTMPRRSVLDIGGYDESFRIKVDVELVLRALGAGIDFRHLESPIVRFFRHRENVSRNRLRGMRAWYRLIDAYCPGSMVTRTAAKIARSCAEAGKWLVGA